MTLIASHRITIVMFYRTPKEKTGDQENLKESDEDAAWKESSEFSLKFCN